MRKFQLTDETMTVDEVTYHRIRACKDFNVQGYHVKAGDLGGYVESEYNIDQDGNAWVDDNAIVSGNAIVSDNAVISGNAVVGGGAWVGDSTRVSGLARVGDNAVISGNARVGSNAVVVGNARVGSNAVVIGNAVINGLARVGGNIIVDDNARVSNSDHIIVIGPIGSRNDYITFCRSKDNDIIVKSGCFNGNISKFLKKVNETYGNNKYAAEYRAAAELAKIHIDLEGEKTE